MPFGRFTILHTVLILL